MMGNLRCASHILRNDLRGAQTAVYDRESYFGSRSSFFANLPNEKRANLPILSSRLFFDTFWRHDYRKTGLELCRRRLLCFFSIVFSELD
jgi:hypothetical protein